jgi:hypothetical protein
MSRELWPVLGGACACLTFICAPTTPPAKEVQQAWPRRAHPINIALLLACGWAGVDIIATVFMVAAGRTGSLDKATRVFDEQAATGAAEPSQTQA